MKINLKDSNKNTWKSELNSGFQTNRLLLKPFKPSNHQWFSEISENDALYRFVPDIQNSADALSWFESVHTKTNYLFYSIHIKKIDRTAGIFMFNMCPDKKMRIGGWIGVEFWNNGYVTELLCGLVSFLQNIGFEHSLYADIHSRNHGAKHALLKSGFKPVHCEGELSKERDEYAFICMSNIRLKK